MPGMTVPAARKDPCLSRYPLRRLRLPMAGGNLAVVLPRGTTWQERNGSAAAMLRGEEPPYWADLWPASVAIARWLCRRRDLSGRSVLDLGCGLGLPGVAAARCGAAVCFADREPDALRFAAFNAAQNRPAHESLAVDGGAVQTVVHDWHANVVPGAFDLVLLADVSYRPRHHAPILRQLRAGLSDSGLALHADPLRRESDGFLAAVHREFCVRQELVDVCVEERRQQVRLCFLAKSPESLQAWFETAADSPPAAAQSPTHLPR